MKKYFLMLALLAGCSTPSKPVDNYNAHSTAFLLGCMNGYLFEKDTEGPTAGIAITMANRDCRRILREVCRQTRNTAPECDYERAKTKAAEELRQRRERLQHPDEIRGPRI